MIPEMKTSRFPLGILRSGNEGLTVVAQPAIGY